MSESREKLFFHWSESSQKFDYYLTGLVATAVVYLTKEHQPALVGLNSPTIELLAIAVWGMSLFAGLKRIEAGVTILRITHDLAPKEEWLVRMRQRRKGRPMSRESTPNVDMTESEVEEKTKAVSRAVDKAKMGLDRKAAVCSVWYTIRNIGFMLGIILLIAAKLSAPYLDATDHSSRPSSAAKSESGHP